MNESVVAEITASSAKPDVSRIAADLGDWEEVRALAAAILGRHDRLDVLIHDAGVLTNERRETTDSAEATVASQVVGPFLLTAPQASSTRRASSSSSPPPSGTGATATSPLMIVIIALVTTIGDLAAPIGIAPASVAMILFGWIVTGGGRPPGFVHGIMVTIFLLFNSFAVDQWLQHRGFGRWRDCPGVRPRTSSSASWPGAPWPGSSTPTPRSRPTDHRPIVRVGRCQPMMVGDRSGRAGGCPLAGNRPAGSNDWMMS